MTNGFTHWPDQEPYLLNSEERSLAKTGLSIVLADLSQAATSMAAKEKIETKKVSEKVLKKAVFKKNKARWM